MYILFASICIVGTLAGLVSLLGFLCLEGKGKRVKPLCVGFAGVVLIYVSVQGFGYYRKAMLREHQYTITHFMPDGQKRVMEVTGDLLSFPSKWEPYWKVRGEVLTGTVVCEEKFRAH